MHEIELKFQVGATERAAVDAAVAGRPPAPRERLQAAYYDTAERALAEAGLALRMRREERRWVQTLKGAGDDGLTRGEHNVPVVAPAGAVPAVDPSLHADTPLGDRLFKVLRGARSPDLRCVFSTDIRRRKRTLRMRRGVVELAFDEGAILAGERRLPVCELEIELVSGSPLAVIDTAQRWVARHGLWLDTRSKAERGDLLTRGETMAPERRARDVELDPGMSIAEAERCVLRSCLDQVSVNGSQVASGEHSDEHVHQLRVGLRRLRTALRLFRDADAALADEATALFRSLGAARNQAAIAQPLAQQLTDALAAIGMGNRAPALVAAPPAAEGPAPDATMRGAAAQKLLLDLHARVQATDADPAATANEPALRDAMARRLKRWHRRVVADAKRFTELGDPGRHTLRKRAKRLRYAIEFASALWGGKAVRRTLKPLRDLLDRLGELIDLTVGMAAYHEAAASDPNALFAVGWLAARHDQLLRACEPELKTFCKIKPFWKG
jgi:triphosphatase